MAKAVSFYLRNSFGGTGGVALDFFDEVRDEGEVEAWSMRHSDWPEKAVLIDRGAIISFTMNRMGLLKFPRGARLLGDFGYRQNKGESIEDMLFRVQNYSGWELAMRHQDVLTHLLLGRSPESTAPTGLSRNPSLPLRGRVFRAMEKTVAAIVRTFR